MARTQHDELDEMQRTCKDLSDGIITLDRAVELMNLQVQRVMRDMATDEAAKNKMNGHRKP